MLDPRLRFYLVISLGISKHKSLEYIHGLSDVSSEQQSLSCIETCDMLHEGQAIVAASQAEATRHCLGVEAVLVLAPEVAGWVSPGSPPRPAQLPRPLGSPAAGQPSW